MNINVFLILAAIVLFFAETIGLWFVNYKMTIPSHRLFAANIVYQLSIVSFVIGLISVPYNALIIAHEQMKAFAQISIIEAILKLLVVAILSFPFEDKLIVYGILMFFVSSLVTASYYFYCHRYFSESKYSLFWRKSVAIEIINFTGWHFCGTISAVLRSQGINILINLFFNPAVNAARAISYQVSNAVNQLSNNFFVAVKPQIYKSYAVSDYSGLYKLIFRSSVICSFLVSILIIPLNLCTEFILSLWLKKVPEHAVLFTQLILWHSLVMSVNNSTIAPALATGRIKWFEICTSGFNCLILPISYIVLKYGGSPESTVVIAIIMGAMTILMQAYMLSHMIGFPIVRYIVLLIKICLSSISMYCFLLFIPQYNNKWAWLGLILVVSICLHFIVYYVIILDNEDRQTINSMIKKKIK